MSNIEVNSEFNWVDPDILAYYEESGEMELLEEHRGLEREFHHFFSEEWQDPKYDDLRPKWDPLVTHEHPKVRVSAKTGLWSVIRLRQGREQGIYVPIVSPKRSEENQAEVA